MNSSTTSPAAWTERYEALRQYVLEGRQRLQSQPLGLALWRAKGMAGWMGHWSRLAEGATAPPPSPVALPPDASAAPGQHQLTLLLAQMTLAQLQPHRPL